MSRWRGRGWVVPLCVLVATVLGVVPLPEAVQPLRPFWLALIVATDWMREVFEPTVRMIPREYRSQIEPAQFFHEVLDHRWFLAEKAGHDVPMGEAVTSYIDNALPSYSLDSKALAELNEEADSGVIDDESTYSDPDDDGYNPDDDPDAAVWSH